MTETTEKQNCEISCEMVGEKGDHEKVLHFHAAHDRPHTLSIFFNGMLDQYVSIDDAALDAMIQKRDEMRAHIKEIDNRGRAWSNCETSAAEKRAAIKTGITHIRNIDEKGIEHIGLVHSFDHSDDEMVLVTDIEPPMTEFHKWDLIHSNIDILDG
jgi:hypothetical protein